jgi:hypothetical protein
MPSSVISLSASIWTKLVTETGVLEKTPGAQFMVLRNQHAARQDAERAFQDAHILVEHQRLNSGAFEQSYHRRNQDCVVCTDKFAHGTYVRLKQLEIQTATGVTLTIRSFAHYDGHQIGLVKAI